MNATAIILQILLLGCAVVASLALFGCESDPILAPQSEVAEEAGGSYGNTNLPVGEANNTQNRVKDAQNRATVTNPKRF